ncbi:MAG: AraC family transcriptional regulator [Hyphomicrobium sp.]|nr:AraC family transcriptional regulator [Hyphomicrobium sp.]
MASADSDRTMLGQSTAPGKGGPSILAAAATGIVADIERQRGDIDRIFGNAGIAPEMAGLPTLKLSLHAFCRLFEQSSRLTRNDNFGLWFGNQFDARDLGLWGYAALSAPTLGEALATLIELLPLHQESTSMHLQPEHTGLMRLDYRIECPQIVERRQDAELSLGMFLNVMREALGVSWSPEEVHFEHPKPSGWRDHQRAFGAPVFFSQPSNALLFKPHCLAMAMPAKDARLLLAMRLCLVRLNQSDAARVCVSDLVSSAVRARLPDGCPPLELIAAEIRLSLKTVKRELRRDGLSYKDLVEKTRHDLALSYIGKHQLPISEIALLLGYSELSAFSRAVRRWTGHSPRALRAQLDSQRDA